MKCLLTRMASVTIWSRLKLLFCLCLVLSSVFVTSSASAINIDINQGGIYQFNTNGALHNIGGSIINGEFVYMGGTRGLKFSMSNGFSISHVELGTNTNFFPGAVVNLYMAVGLTNNEIQNPSHLSMIQPNNGPNVAILDVEEISNAQEYFRINYELAPDGSNTMIPGSVQEYKGIMGYKITALVLKPTNDIRLIFSNFGSNPVFGDLLFIPGSYFTLQNETEDISANIGSLKEEIQASKQQAHDDAQKQLDATNKQTEQQKEQYDQEKQEEADRENQGKDDMDQATGIFNFNFLNPFSGIFALFSPASSCASIPTLARWVHSDTSTVCSWWSADVRSVLTPVFGISSMILLFGFIVNWLRNAGTGGGVDIGWDSKWYSPHHGEKF